jgi:hypothetical protein
MRPREHPDGDLAVLAGDCILEIPRYLQTLTVDWRRYVFLVRWRWRVSSTLISRTLAGHLFDMQITFPREKVRIKPGMGSLTDEG